MSVYNEDYFEHGITKGISGAENYRWMPGKSFSFVLTCIDTLGIDRKHVILDFGCAKGFAVRAMRAMDYNAWGCDISEYAISHADEHVRDNVKLIDGGVFDFGFKFDIVIAKTVFEHVDQDELDDILDRLVDVTTDDAKMLVVVPLAITDGGPYVLSCDEADVTHVARKTLRGWVVALENNGAWEITEARKHVKGINEYKSKLGGVGIFTLAKKKDAEQVHVNMNEM